MNRDTITRETGRAQKLESAVMAESWVASGLFDVGVFGACAPWDMAVGVVLVREAGGVPKTVKMGESDWASLFEGRCVFGNEVLVDNLRDAFTPAEVETVLDTEYDW